MSLKERNEHSGYSSDSEAISNEYTVGMYAQFGDVRRKRRWSLEESQLNMAEQNSKRRKLEDGIQLQALKKLQNAEKHLKIIYKRVLKLFEANNYNPIAYYRLVIDPYNHDRTVDNSLQLMSLTYFNLITIIEGLDGYPYVRLATEEELKCSIDAHKICQYIGLLNMENCKIIVDFYGIQKSLLDVAASLAEEKDNSAAENEMMVL